MPPATVSVAQAVAGKANGMFARVARIVRLSCRLLIGPVGFVVRSWKGCRMVHTQQLQHNVTNPCVVCACV